MSEKVSFQRTNKIKNSLMLWRTLENGYLETLSLLCNGVESHVNVSLTKILVFLGLK
jgi:hypothetical protein